MPQGAGGCPVGFVWGGSHSCNLVTERPPRAHLCAALACPRPPPLFLPGSKKSAKSTKKSGEGKRRKRRIESFSSYIYKVLKQVHPGP
jgi:hypothetical protein